MLTIDLILIILCCFSILYVPIYGFIKSSKDREDAEIKALYDDYKENCR